MDPEFLSRAERARKSEASQEEKNRRELEEFWRSQEPYRNQARDRVQRVQSWCKQLSKELAARSVPYEHTFTCDRGQMKEVGLLRKKWKWFDLPSQNWASGWIVVEKETFYVESGSYEREYTIHGVTGVLLDRTGALVHYEFKDKTGVHIRHTREFLDGKDPEDIIPEEFFQEIFVPWVWLHNDPMRCFKMPYYIEMDDLENALVGLARRHNIA